MVRLRMSFVHIATYKYRLERLFTKYRAAGVSEFQSLLDWRNTLSELMDTSPAQRLVGRRCCQLLMPEFSLDNDAAKLCA